MLSVVSVLVILSMPIARGASYAKPPQTESKSSKTVVFKNQKAGQFCKNLDVNKTVKTPSGILKCSPLQTANGERAKWQHI